MPRTREENQRIREEQKQHILKAAVKVLAYKGISTTTMADIATEANVSYGLVYHYFPNKEQVLDELLQWALDEHSRYLQQALEQPGSPLDRLQWFTDAFLHTLKAHPEYIILLHHMLHDEDLHHKLRDKKHEIVEKADSKIKGVLRDLIIEGQRSGEIAPDDPDLLLTTYMACTRGLILSTVIQKRSQQLPDACIILRLLRP